MRKFSGEGDKSGFDQLLTKLRKTARSVITTRKRGNGTLQKTERN